MSEEPLETHELREQLEEAREHAEGHHAEGPRWTLYLSLSTAIIAVFAAVGALQSGHYESHALLAKNEAILAQAKATDEWAWFQAKGMKAAMYEAQAEAAAGNEAVVKRLEGQRDKYKHEQDELQKKADELEHEVKLKGEEGERFFAVHHQFALAVTIFQVSIALSAIAALTRRRPLWFVSMLVGASGIFYFLKGFGLFGGAAG
jgi:hypothetical protein